MTQDIDTGHDRRTARLAAEPALPAAPGPERRARPVTTAVLTAAAVVGLVLAVLALVVGVARTIEAPGAGGARTSQSTAVHQVTYRVTTTRASRIQATYSQARHGDLTTASVRGVASPWTVQAEVSGFVGPNVVASLTPDADHVGRSDRITCTILVDGVQVADESDWGPNASVSCTP